MFVSLGSNCSITWHMNNFKVRNIAYPFDWTSINNLDIINNVLKNNWSNFVDSIYLDKISSLHPEIDNSNNIIDTKSFIFKNSYNVKWAHLSIELDTFKESIKRRIDRFQELKNKKETINFIRIELSPIKKSYEKKLLELIKNLDKLNPNYCLHLIVHKLYLTNINQLTNKIKIYYYDKFSSDWKQEHLSPIFSIIFRNG